MRVHLHFFRREGARALGVKNHFEFPVPAQDSESTAGAGAAPGGGQQPRQSQALRLGRVCACSCLWIVPLGLNSCRRQPRTPLAREAQPQGRAGVYRQDPNPALGVPGIISEERSVVGAATLTAGQGRRQPNKMRLFQIHANSESSLMT